MSSGVGRRRGSSTKEGVGSEAQTRRSSKSCGDIFSFKSADAGTRPRGSSIDSTTAPRKSTAASSVGEKAPETFIRAMVRIRPKLAKEMSDRDGVKAPYGGRSVVLSNGQEQKQFNVDDVFDSRNGAASQIAIFDQFGKDFVLLSLKGYNICVFAYGHTGSGKTYTLLGDGEGSDVLGEGVGLLPRFLHEIFQTHSQDPRRRGMRYSCEFYEVYNEQIRDLLAPNNAERKRKVHVHPKHGVRIDGSTPSLVTSAEEALGLVNFGNQMRTVATTTMNERSSRSHAVVVFKFWFAHLGNLADDMEGASSVGPTSTIGSAVGSNGLLDGVGNAEALPFCESTLTFVDLAGREDQHASSNQAVQFREMCFINTSLFHLANVIQKLAEGQVESGSLADFRNTKLTLLLSQALAGNCRSALVATVAPLQSCFDDSVHTLTFAQSVKKIHTCAVVNNKGSGRVVKELEFEVQQLRRELSQSQTNSTEKEQGLLAAQALIDYYQRSYEDARVCSNQVKKARSSFCNIVGVPDPADTLSVQSPKSPAGELLPFFSKLSDDPSLQGCCNFHVWKSILVIGSCEQSCDIVLRGLGIAPRMCEVRPDPDDGRVYVVVLNAESYGNAPRVLVNGEPLVHGMAPRAMEHGDSIMLGYAHAFRLVKPSKSEVEGLGPMNKQALAKRTVGKLDMASVVAEIVDDTGMQFKEVYPFLQQLSSHVPEATLNSFMKALHCICPLIDEANLITREVFGNEELRFQLYTLANPFDFGRGMPEFAVCLLQMPRPVTRCRDGGQTIIHERKGSDSRSNDHVDRDQLLGGGDDENWEARHPLLHALGLAETTTVDGQELLYVWSLEKFLRRLNEIREIYHEGSEARDNFAGIWQKLSKKPFLNPWRELRFADVKLFAEDIGRILRNVKDVESSGMSWITQFQDPACSNRLSEGVQELLAAAFVREEDFSSPPTSARSRHGSNVSTTPGCADGFEAHSTGRHRRHLPSPLKLAETSDATTARATRSGGVEVPRWSSLTQQNHEPLHLPAGEPETQDWRHRDTMALLEEAPKNGSASMTAYHKGTPSGEGLPKSLMSVPDSWSHSSQQSQGRTPYGQKHAPIVPHLHLPQTDEEVLSPPPPPSTPAIGLSTDRLLEVPGPPSLNEELAALDKVHQDVNEIRRKLAAQRMDAARPENENSSERLGELLNRFEVLLQNVPRMLAAPMQETYAFTPPVPLLAPHGQCYAWPSVSVPANSRVVSSSVTVPRASSPSTPKLVAQRVAVSSPRQHGSSNGRWSIGCPGQGSYSLPLGPPRSRGNSMTAPPNSSSQSGLLTPLSARTPAPHTARTSSSFLSAPRTDSSAPVPCHQWQPVPIQRRSNQTLGGIGGIGGKANSPRRCGPSTALSPRSSSPAPPPKPADSPQLLTSMPPTNKVHAVAPPAIAMIPRGSAPSVATSSIAVSPGAVHRWTAVPL